VQSAIASGIAPSNHKKHTLSILTTLLSLSLMARMGQKINEFKRAFRHTHTSHEWVCTMAIKSFGMIKERIRKRESRMLNEENIVGIKENDIGEYQFKYKIITIGQLNQY
jgi:hypothetical protein